MSYTDIFGGKEINPSDLSYGFYPITTDLTLVWPVDAAEGANVAFSKMDIQALGGGLSVFLPSATQQSVGQDFLINNVGVSAFTVKDSVGNTIISISSGQQFYLYLTDNSTSAGVWRVVQFGVGMSAAIASALAGAGLRANITRLDQNLPTTPLNGDYTLGVNDRATVVENTGGAVTYTFPNANTLGNGWFVYVINAGTGIITLTPSAGTIDGGSTKIINPGESCAVFSDNTNYRTLGYGRSLVTTVTAAAIDVSGGGTINLTAPQVSAQVQDFTGALPGNTIVQYGAVVGYWFVYNNTTGAHTLTARLNNIDPGVVLAQGNFTILRSNGTNMSVAFTATTGTVTEIDTAAGELTGGPITTLGTIGLANTAVTPGSYGDASHTLMATVDAKGRLTALGAVAISITIDEIQSFTSAQFAARLTDPMGTGRVVFDTNATLTTPTITNGTANTQAPGDASTKIANDAFVAAAIAGVHQTWQGQCRLNYTSTTQITLVPNGGNVVMVAGAYVGLAAGGVSAANTNVTVNGVAAQNLAASTVYLVGFNGTTLEFWTIATGHSADSTAGNIGVEVITGHVGVTLVGMVQTDSSTPGQFSSFLTRSWFNRPSQSNSASATKTIGFTVLAEVDPAYRVPFLCWADDFVQIQASGYIGQSGIISETNAVLAIDGVETGPVAKGNIGGDYTGLPFTCVVNGPLAEGSHTATLWGSTGAIGSASTYGASVQVVLGNT